MWKRVEEIFDNDAVLPSQFTSLWSGDKYLAPEWRVWHAVLLDGVECALGHGSRAGESAGEKQAARREARQWISQQGEHFGSFRWCCHLFNVDPDSAIAAINRAVAARESEPRMSFKEVAEYTTLKLANIKRLRMAGKFPQPIYWGEAGRRVVWRVKDIDEWMRLHLHEVKEIAARSISSQERTAALSVDDILDIRRRRLDGMHQAKIGAIYGISPTTVARICRGERHFGEKISQQPPCEDARIMVAC